MIKCQGPQHPSALTNTPSATGTCSQTHSRPQSFIYPSIHMTHAIFMFLLSLFKEKINEKSQELEFHCTDSFNRQFLQCNWIYVYKYVYRLMHNSSLDIQHMTVLHYAADCFSYSFPSPSQSPELSDIAHHPHRWTKLLQKDIQINVCAQYS